MIVLSLLLAAMAPAPVLVAQHSVRHVVHRRVRHIARHAKPIDTRLRLAGCGYSATGKCAAARSRYRLPLDEPLPSTAKSDALAQTGTRCALIGQTICATPPTQILHMEK
jgi:hypothetical protein